MTGPAERPGATLGPWAAGGGKDSLLIMAPNKQVRATAEAAAPGPNPRRIAAGKLNRSKRRGLTPEGRQRLREAAMRNKPWAYSTGPRTPAGKAKVAQNGKALQKGPLSVRQLRGELAELRALAREMREGRQRAAQ